MSAAAAPVRLLLTGFEPFGGEPVNPSELLVREFAAGEPPVPGMELVPVVLPVDRARLAPELELALADVAPHAVVAVGQSTGRDRVHLEARAVNTLDYRGATDNGGHGAAGEVLEPGGPQVLEVVLPLQRLARELADEGLPVAVSFDAGRHLCNALLYLLLHRHPTLPALFVHVPLLPEQAARRGGDETHLPLAVSRRCLRALLSRLPARLPPGPPARP